MGADSEATSDLPATPRRLDLKLAESSGSYELVLGAVLFGLIGLVIDRQLGTTPAFLLLLTIAGLAGASISIYYRYKHRIAELKAETEAMRTAKSGGR